MNYVIMVVFVLGVRAGEPVREDIFIGEDNNWSLAKCETVYESVKREFLRLPELRLNLAESGCITDRRRRILDF